MAWLYTDGLNVMTSRELNNVRRLAQRIILLLLAIFARGYVCIRSLIREQHFSAARLLFSLSACFTNETTLKPTELWSEFVDCLLQLA